MMDELWGGKHGNQSAFPAKGDTHGFPSAHILKGF
jgi:hypothetical protein